MTLFLGGWLRPFPSVSWLAFLKFAPVPILLFAAYWCVVHGLRLPAAREWRWQRLMLLGLGGGALLLGALLAIPAVADAIQGVFWFLFKVSWFLYAFIWLRGTFPRYRFDQLMRLGWHFMIPVAIANTIFCGVGVILWQRLGWSFPVAMLAGTTLTLLVATVLAREQTD